jgi:hypothetical protein
MTNNSPFSGGGTPVDPNAPPAPIPAAVSGLIDILNVMGTRRYVIDMNGNKLELAFKPTGFVTVKSGDGSMELPFTVGTV